MRRRRKTTINTNKTVFVDGNRLLNCFFSPSIFLMQTFFGRQIIFYFKLIIYINKNINDNKNVTSKIIKFEQSGIIVYKLIQNKSKRKIFTDFLPSTTQPSINNKYNFYRKVCEVIVLSLDTGIYFIMIIQGGRRALLIEIGPTLH